MNKMMNEMIYFGICSSVEFVVETENSNSNTNETKRVSNKYRKRDKSHYFCLRFCCHN